MKTESGPEPARVVAAKNAERRSGPKGRGGQQKAGSDARPPCGACSDIKVQLVSNRPVTAVQGTHFAGSKSTGTRSDVCALERSVKQTEGNRNPGYHGLTPLFQAWLPTDMIEACGNLHVTHFHEGGWVGL